MKTYKIINLLKKMNSKSTLKNFLKFSLGIGLFIPLLKSQPANAATPCPTNDSVTTMSGQANPCFTTPEKLEVTFFEIGFCSSDPLSTGTFDDSTCSKTWDNTSGYKTDIGKKTFEDMVGNVYKVPNATYSHAYAIMNNTWTYKAKYKLKDGDTYYTLSNGAQTTNESQYVDWTDDISDMLGEETTGLCYDYSMSTNNGTVTAVLADSNRVSATDTTSCDNATRVIGSVALNSSLTMDNSVKGYKLEWQITNLGVGLTYFSGDNLPNGWRGGPFTPKFTLIK